MRAVHHLLPPRIGTTTELGHRSEHPLCVALREPLHSAGIPLRQRTSTRAREAARASR